MKDVLRDEIEKIQGLCKTNERVVFHGGIKKSQLTKIIWQNNLDPDNNFNDFLTTFFISSSKILLLYTELNTLVLEENEVKEAFADLEEDEEKLELQETIDLIRKTKGHTIHYKVGFIEGANHYEYKKNIDWLENYLEIKDIFTDEISEDTLTNKNNDTENFVPIPEDEKERIARIVVKVSEFSTAKTPLDRKELAKKIAAENGVDHWYNQKMVGDKAEHIYMREIQPKLDEELREKIHNLKDKGFSKAKIKGTLGISVTQLEKHYYK